MKKKHRRIIDEMVECLSEARWDLAQYIPRDDFAGREYTLADIDKLIAKAKGINND